MTLTLALAADVSPAMAVAKPATVAKPASLTTIIGVIKQLYSIYQQFKGGGGGLTLAQATQEIINAINTEQTAILTQIDAVATAQVRACAEAAVINAKDIPSFTTDTLQAFANDTTSCVAQADTLIPVVGADRHAVDALGFALGVIGPIALIARSHAGFSTDTLRNTLIHANTAVINVLTPSCSTVGGFNYFGTFGPIWTDYWDVTDPNWVPDGGPFNGDDIAWTWACTAFDGTTANGSNDTIWPDTSPPLPPGLDRQAGANTSYPVTLDDLATLQTL